MGRTAAPTREEESVRTCLEDGLACVDAAETAIRNGDLPDMDKDRLLNGLYDVQLKLTGINDRGLNVYWGFRKTA